MGKIFEEAFLQRRFAGGYGVQIRCLEAPGLEGEKPHCNGQHLAPWLAGRPWAGHFLSLSTALESSGGPLQTP